MKEIESSKLKVESLIEEYKFRDALFEVIDLSPQGKSIHAEERTVDKRSQMTKHRPQVPKLKN